MAEEAGIGKDLFAGACGGIAQVLIGVFMTFPLCEIFHHTVATTDTI